MEPSAEQMVKLYTDMVRSRAFEELVISLVPQGKISWTGTTTPKRRRGPFPSATRVSYLKVGK